VNLRIEAIYSAYTDSLKLDVFVGISYATAQIEPATRRVVSRSFDGGLREPLIGEYDQIATCTER